MSTTISKLYTEKEHRQIAAQVLIKAKNEFVEQSKTPEYCRTIEEYRKVAEQGELLNLLLLGELLSKGKDQNAPKHIVEARQWFKVTAEHGDALSQLVFGIILLPDFHGRYDFIESIKWIQKAVDQGLVKAQALLGYLLWDSSYSKRISQKGQIMTLIRDSAEKGCADGQTILGEFLRYGRLFPKNPKEAIEWTKKAAAQGNHYALYNLSSMFCEGSGVLEDLKESFEWLIRSVETRKDRLTLFWLKRHYVYSEEWHDMIRAKLICQALQRAGVHFLNRQIIPGECECEPKLENAVTLFQTELETIKDDLGQRRLELLKNLGFCYHLGLGVTQNYKTACDYYEKAQMLDKDGKCLWDLFFVYRHGYEAGQLPLLNLEEFLKDQKQLAEKGNPNSSVIYAYALEKNVSGIDQSIVLRLESALQFYHKAKDDKYAQDKIKFYAPLFKFREAIKEGLSSPLLTFSVISKATTASAILTVSTTTSPNPAKETQITPHMSIKDTKIVNLIAEYAFEPVINQVSKIEQIKDLGSKVLKRVFR